MNIKNYIKLEYQDDPMQMHADEVEKLIIHFGKSIRDFKDDFGSFDVYYEPEVMSWLYQTNVYH